MDITQNPQPLKRAHVAPLIAGVMVVGLLLAIFLFKPSGSEGAPAGDRPGCSEEQVEPQYAKWVRERENPNSAWGEWYLYDGGSVTNWTGGSGFIHENMQYEYRPNGETRTVTKEVECPTTTTTAPATTTTVVETTTTVPQTTTTVPDTTSSTTSVPSTTTPPTTTEPPVTTSTVVVTVPTTPIDTTSTTVSPQPPVAPPVVVPPTPTSDAPALPVTR